MSRPAAGFIGGERKKKLISGVSRRHPAARVTDGIHQFGAAQLRRSAARLYAEAHPNQAGYFGLVFSPQAISRTQRRLFLTYRVTTLNVTRIWIELAVWAAMVSTA